VGQWFVKNNLDNFNNAVNALYCGTGLIFYFAQFWSVYWYW